MNYINNSGVYYLYLAGGEFDTGDIKLVGELGTDTGLLRKASVALGRPAICCRIRVDNCRILR